MGGVETPLPDQKYKITKYKNTNQKNKHPRGSQ